MNYRLRTGIIVIFLLFLLSACSTLETTPRNTENLCAIFTEKSHWLAHADKAADKWGIPIHVQMAIMHQESHFVADAKPPRRMILGFIPWFRPSSAYGYAQALDGTWREYLNSARGSRKRDRFADACDFIGWYCHASHQQLGISKQDAYKLYLAYHEGNDGYKRKTYLDKQWLLEAANKVSLKAEQYRKQLNNCR